mmetsp:Transcript_14378/g.17421  ORF Transcript_14378/g.17421 Transcript_14378/m.17421 type:complete len:258 (-) Transcript_14378:104-877(-)|eukprot:CAMPEP_0197860450 /NCGR_PEP_ID=MMETSP1438-20131217/35827_1 /TAXON_ID=1461541 /ORGANISM="Pterosperma sp., Strain CCMP1384" /LENGTH=257 /DNA_ID=CAMNT_0043477313 /DNA_START=206 /DNA_END=979 /DNA_ORIENTATION=+
MNGLTRSLHIPNIPNKVLDQRSSHRLQRCSPRGKFGHNFQTLTKDQGSYMRTQCSLSTYEAVNEFWLEQGVTREAHRKHLATECTTWIERDPTTEKKLLTLGVQPDIRNIPRSIPEIDSQLRRLQAILPGVSVAKVLWKRPAILTVKSLELARRVSTLCTALPGVDVGAIIKRDLMLLIIHDASQQAEDAMERLATLLPNADTARLIQREPSLLFQDIEDGLNYLRAAMPSQDISRLIDQNPAIVLSIQSNRSLSIH